MPLDAVGGGKFQGDFRPPHSDECPTNVACVDSVMGLLYHLDGVRNAGGEGVRVVI